MIDGLLSIKPIQKTEGKMDKSKIPLLTKDGPIQVWTLALLWQILRGGIPKSVFL
jgi:hypothetical protein